MSNEIVEGNKLIAEFMGRKFYAYKGNHSYNKEFNTYKECEEWIGGKLKDDGYAPEIGWELGCGKYHSSWDWLMPVVEKIENWTYRFHIEYCGSVAMPFKFYVFIDMYHVAGPAEEILETDYYDSKIKAAWNGIIQFIQWHNEKHKAQVSDTTEAK